MIGYTNITAGEVYEAAIAQIGRHRLPENIGFADVFALINRAIQEIYVIALPLNLWHFISTMDVQHRTVLPRNMSKPIRVLVSETGTPPYRDCRYVHPREWHLTTDWNSANEWRRATAEKPVYTIWGTGQTMMIMIYPNTEYQTGTVPDNHYYSTANYSGIMEYHSMPAEVTSRGDVINVPVQCEDMVVLSTTIRLLAKMDPQQSLIEMHKLLAASKELMLKELQLYKSNQVRESAKYVPPMVPVYHKPNEAKGLPNVLVVQNNDSR